IVVYPDGTGSGSFLTWNAGALFRLAGNRADDIAFLREMLDDLGKMVNVDAKRVFATGMSNGGMMCYRLAAEMADRIAAIAPVAGTMAVPRGEPKRAMAVLHFHGTEDVRVAYVPNRGARFRSGVDETMWMWALAS